LKPPDAIVSNSNIITALIVNVLRGNVVEEIGVICSVIKRDELGNNCVILLEPGAPFPVIEYEDNPGAKIGETSDVAIPTPVFVHDPSSGLLDCSSVFVRATSSSKPFGASVMGSWSKRGVSAGAVSMRPWEFTKEAIDARVNVGTGNVTGAGAKKGIVRAMAALDSR
jgi:hypothetical protein